MDLAPPRGTQDLLAPRSELMLGLYEEAHRAAGLFGFRYVETPTFEDTELFARTAGATSDVVTKEMYTFDDKGGRSLTLRPESTAPVVRAYLARAHDLPLPFKAYYVAQQFRHGRPQAGRLREFRQFGVETIGAAGPSADVEVIALADRYLRDRGVRDVRLRVNSIGDETCRPAYRKLLVAHLEPHAAELCEDCRLRLHVNPMRILDCKVDGVKRFVLDAPLISDHLCEPCASQFMDVRREMQAEGIAFEHDPRLVRGLDYYTRTAFEFESGALAAAQATVCGGGRYDGLAEVLGGDATPGVGFALGLDRALLASSGDAPASTISRGLRCFVVAIGEDGLHAGRALVRELREGGVATEAALEPRPLKAQLRMADRSGADLALIVGPGEVDRGVVTVKRLADQLQRELPRDELVGAIHRGDVV